MITTPPAIALSCPQKNGIGTGHVSISAKAGESNREAYMSNDNGRLHRGLPHYVFKHVPVFIPHFCGYGT